MRIYNLLVCLILLPSLHLLSQNISESVYQINYSVYKGLPSGETYDVFHDSKGFVWVGTDKGIARYDGNEFEVFTTNDGLTDNTVLRFMEDEKQRIWMITYNRRLCYFENGNFYPYRYNDLIVSNLKDIYVGITITNLQLDTHDNLHLDLINYTGLTIDSMGNVIVKESEYKQLAHQIFHESKPKQEMVQDINAILNTYFEKKKLTVKFRGLEVCHFYRVEDYVVKTGRKGVQFYNPKTGKIIKSILENYFITGMTVDFELGYWFSTLSAGIIYVPEVDISYYPIEALSSNPNFISIVPQGDKLVFGYSGNQFDNYYINRDRNSLDVYEEHLNFFDIPKTIRRGGLKFENSIKLFPFKVTARTVIEVDSSLLFYASNSLGLRKLLKAKGGEWIESTIDCPKINKIINKGKGELWLATTEGLYLYNIKLNKITADSLDPVFNKESIQDIINISDTHFIIATRVSGIFLKIADSVIHYHSNNKLISNYINHLFYDSVNKMIYIATNKGVCVFSWTGTSFSKVVNTLNTNNGINSTDIRLIFLDDSTLYFGSNLGVSYVKTGSLNHKDSSPKLYLKNVFVDEEEYAYYSNMSFDYGQNTISFIFRAISYNSFSDLTYKFKIEDIHKKWQVTDYSKISFFALMPGEYTLLVKAINSGGIESKAIRLQFVITPLFWMEWWFKALLFILISLLLTFFVKALINRYRTKAQLEVDVLKLKAMNLQSKMNPHFIFNSLNSIQHYIITNNSDKANDYLIDFSNLTRRVLKNSDSPKITLKDELETIQLYVNLELRRLSRPIDFKVEVDPSIQQDNCIIPALLIQPYVENSIWHGKLNQIANGTIIIRVFLKQGQLYFEIEDNGIGYLNNINTTKNRSKSYGIGVTKERIQLMESLNTKLSKVIVTNSKNLTCLNNNLGTLVQFNLPYIKRK